TQEGALALADARGARLDSAAHRCVLALEHGGEAPPARLALNVSVEGEAFLLETLWDPSVGDAFERLPGTSDGGRSLPLDPWVVTHLDAFLATPGVAIDAPAEHALEELREEAAEAAAAIRR